MHPAEGKKEGKHIVKLFTRHYTIYQEPQSIAGGPKIIRNLTDKLLKTVASQGGEILQNKPDELLTDDEVTTRKLLRPDGLRDKFSL